MASPADSQTILNTSGAENLLGKGDSLFLEENGTLTRILGALVRNEDIENALQPYRVRQQSKTTAYALEQAELAEQRKLNAEQKKSGSFFVWICDIWNRLGRRNQSKIIKAAFSLLTGIIGVKNSSRSVSRSVQANKRR